MWGARARRKPEPIWLRVRGFRRPRQLGFSTDTAPRSREHVARGLGAISQTPTTRGPPTSLTARSDSRLGVESAPKRLQTHRLDIDEHPLPLGNLWPVASITLRDKNPHRQTNGRGKCFSRHQGNCDRGGLIGQNGNVHLHAPRFWTRKRNAHAKCRHCRTCIICT